MTECFGTDGQFVAVSEADYSSMSEIERHLYDDVKVCALACEACEDALAQEEQHLRDRVADLRDVELALAAIPKPTQQDLLRAVQASR